MFNLIRHQGSVVQTHNETQLTHTRMIWVKKDRYGGFPAGPVVKNLPAKAGDTSSIPGLGRFPHTLGQLSPCTPEPVLRNERSHCRKKPVHQNKEQVPLAATRDSPCNNTYPAQPKKKKKICFKRRHIWDFPGGPVVKTPCCQCMGSVFHSWSGN